MLWRSRIPLRDYPARRIALVKPSALGDIVHSLPVLTAGDPLGLHAVERYWLVAKAFGVGQMPRRFRVPITEPARLWASELLQNWPRPWIAMGVGSRWMTKRWPPEHFAEPARRAQAY